MNAVVARLIADLRTLGDPSKTPGGSRLGAAPFWPMIAALAVLKLVVQLFALEGYGYFRDELYYLACADHLAWGYVDHPPLSIAVLSLVTWLFGEGLWAIRWVPALAGALTVAVVGWIAARLGGGPWAQGLAMVGWLTPPVFWGLGHFYSMNALGLLFWALAAALFVHLLDGGRRLGWPVLGFVLGLGLLNKVDVLWLGAGLGVGLLISGRHHLTRMGPWLAGAISIWLLAPHLLWQQVHGWPTLEFVRNAGTQKMRTISAADYLASQVDMMQPITLPLWLGGLFFLLLSPKMRPVRAAGWIYPAVLLILVANGTSRTVYLAGAYSLLMAAGAVAWAHWLSARPKLARASLGIYAAALLGWSALVMPFGLPILPVDTYLEHAARLGVGPSTEERKEVGPLPQFYADMFGWPEMAAEVARVTQGLDPEERRRSAIFVGNYGQAGALRLFGRDHGLPPVLSGHNAHWMWGRDILATGEVSGETLVILGGSERDHRRVYAEVELAGRTACTYCMPYENGVPIYIARRPSADLGDAWSRIKHYD